LFLERFSSKETAESFKITQPLQRILPQQRRTIVSSTNRIGLDPEARAPIEHSSQLLYPSPVYQSLVYHRVPEMKTTRLVLAVMTFLIHNTNAGTQEQLEACRQQIDSLDQRIVELVQERAQVVEKVGKIKREAHLPVTVPSREQQVIAKAQELAKGGPLPAEAVGRIYQKLVEEMRNWEAKLDATVSQSSSQRAAAK
jgi:chorismate mutase